MDGLALALLPLALAVALSPFPIVPVILLLLTDRPRANGGSFLLGWFVGLVVAVGAFTVAATAVELWDETPTWASWTRIVLGVVLIVLGVRTWLSAGGKAKETPSWMRSFDGYTPGRAAKLGLLLAVANPKVLLLALAAGVTIGSAELGRTSSIVAVVLFALVAASTVATPVVLHLVMGTRISGPLGTAKGWLASNNDTVMSVVFIAIGAMLLIKGASGL